MTNTVGMVSCPSQLVCVPVQSIVQRIGASSKYQMLMGDLTLLAISSTANANMTGPSGSTCWTPVSERIVSLAITRWPLVAYAVDDKRRIDGAFDEQTSRK